MKVKKKKIMNNVKAYLEDYHYIKLLIPNAVFALVDLNNLYLIGNKSKIKLYVYKKDDADGVIHLHTAFRGRIRLHIDYVVSLNNIDNVHLDLGKIIRSPRFDIEYNYTGPLGIEYSPTSTTFRVWSPVAKEIELCLTLPEKATESIHFEYKNKGLWEIEVAGDLECAQYYYEVRINGEKKRCLDPYAVSSNANSEFNYVIDMGKTYQFKHKTPKFSGNYTDAVIYELNLRDFSANRLTSQSYYLAALDSRFTKNNQPAGLDYLKDLGITHLQLMPINAFGGVDENNPDTMYNWGYNPVEYNVPSGWYASDPNDPYARINELKQMVDGIHQKGLLVNMDVVYNHVYHHETFPFNILVPGYCYRTDGRGYMTNGSGCGNDLATERVMMRRFINDSILHWMFNYSIDGFRFDLMGLIDYETMNKIVEVAKNVQPNTMIYGEGWDIPTGIPANKCATSNNFWAVPEIAFFNDTFRNTIKGSPFESRNGFVGGGHPDIYTMSHILKGSASNEFLYSSAEQSINYVECHDNYTLIDQLKKNNPMMTSEELHDQASLGIAIVILSAGVPFIHAGQELFRSKQGYDNSYNLGDGVNQINFEDIDQYQDNLKMIKTLLTIRREYPPLRLADPYLIDKMYTFDVRQTASISYTIKGEPNLKIIIKNNYQEEALYFAPGTTLIFNGKEKVNQAIDTLIIAKPGVYIINKGC